MGYRGDSFKFQEKKLNLYVQAYKVQVLWVQLFEF